MNKLSILENLSFNTTQVRTFLDDDPVSIGTGFYYNLPIEGCPFFPVLVTCKHVVEDSNQIRIRVNRADDYGNPEYQKQIEYTIDDSIGILWLPHPDPEVDLCIVPVLGFIHHMEENNIKIFFRTIPEEYLLSPDELKELDVVEDVLMVGYPSGNWDKANNQPIFRKGVTATHPFLNYNDKKEFYIDAGVFSGSSGSPVVLFNRGGYTTKHGEYIPNQTRIKLLGIFNKGKLSTDDVEVTIYENDEPYLFGDAATPNGLGVVIKAERIFEFKQPMQAKLAEIEKMLEQRKPKN